MINFGGSATAPGRVAPPWARPGGSGTSRPVAVLAAGFLGVVVPDDTIGECSALPGSVLCILVPRTLAIQESIQVRLVEGGAELGPFGDGDGVLGATLAVPVLGRLGAVMLLPVARWAVIAVVFRAVVPLRETLGVVILVPTAGPLGFFHVGMLVDDRHHVAHGLGVGLKHLPP